MTNPEPPSAPRRHLLLYFTLTTAALVIAWVTYFLLNFDLNNYRQQTEEQLSSLLSLPVKIGDVHYAINETRLALHAADLEIGDNDSALQIKSPSIVINLKWRGLLERDFKFTKISMTQPQMWLKAFVKEQASDEKPLYISALSEIDQALLHKISIDALEIIDGALHIETSRSNEPTQLIDISKFSGEITDLRLSRTIQLSFKGDLSLPGQLEPSPWQLHGDSSLELGKNNALEPHINLDLNLKRLDLNTLTALFAEEFASFSVKGSANLQLHIEGTPDRNIGFQTELSSKSIELSPSPAYAKPITVKRLLASGQLQIDDQQPGINNLSLEIDESHLTGHIDWTSQGKATITLLKSNLTISQLKQWIPDTLETWHTIQKDLGDQGSIHIDLATFTLLGGKGSQKNWQIDHFNGELREAAWSSDKSPTIEIISLPLTFSDKLWQIDHGRGQWGSLPLTLDGTGEYTRGGIVLTTLDFTGEVFPAKLLNEWDLPQPSFLTNGSIGLNGHLEGTLDKLNLDLQANLSQFNLSHPGVWALTPQPEDNITLHATLSPQEISLDHGAMTWSVVKGHISGEYRLDHPEDLTVDAFLKLNDLSRLAEVLPFLEILKLHGQAELSISQKGLPESNPPETTLTLRDAGLHATRHIADLSLINGRVRLTTTGLTAKDLRVHLGKSPVTVQVQIEDFTKPRLLIDAVAPTIYADDLVFYSDQALLRDIDGHLEIDKDGLLFAPVDVRLDGGTKASVRGTISFHEPFDVALDITSEFARISEVIDLWADQSERSRERSASTENGVQETETETKIEINASVKNGDLYGMRFHDASGLIVPSHNRLTIHPLDFSVGDGFCNAQVINEFSNDGPTLLRISGHAQDVDAQEVYQELLNQKNIVHGKLRGDFYLNGEIGSNYLPSSYGNFSIQIHDGVLRKFQVLSKVFSLLNISQIFALKLPDMDQEGMPFDLLSANFHLDKGILSSEDLKIQSEAMNQSYIGQFNLIDNKIDLALALHPLGTVDKIVSRIPLAGWLLTGEDKALLTAYFSVKGNAGDASVIPLPLGTITEPTFGLLKRTLRLPFKLFEDPEILWGGEDQKD